MNPLYPSEISGFNPPSPLEFPVTFRGGGGYGYFLEPHNANTCRVTTEIFSIRLVHSCSFKDKYTLKDNLKKPEAWIKVK